ncbi:MAG: polysaccharide deacetylase family protein [Clostridia bacterium]|nr:polysaccharide deacetylase family protein [Clostridia bacterium]
MKHSKSQIVLTNIAIVMVLTLLLISTLYTGTTATFVQQNNALYYGNREGNSVCLMFNVYQGTEFIEQIMQTFKSFDFTTTFFVGGIWVEKNEDLVKKMSDEGFEIANHGYLHRDSDKLSLNRNREEIVITERLIASIIGKEAVKLFAPPSGAIGSNMFNVCNELEYKVIMWTRDTIDWRDQDSELIHSRATKNLSAGDLILMHPTQSTTDALAQVLEYIKEQGLVASTVTQTLSNAA